MSVAINEVCGWLSLFIRAIVSIKLFLANLVSVFLTPLLCKYDYGIFVYLYMKVILEGGTVTDVFPYGKTPMELRAEIVITLLYERWLMANLNIGELFNFLRRINMVTFVSFRYING